MDRNLSQNLARYREDFGNSADLVIRTFTITGTPAAILSLESMIDKKLVAEAVLQPILHVRPQADDPITKLDLIYQSALATVDQQMVDQDETAIERLMNGFALLFLDGNARAIAFGVQGYASRSVSEPQNESMQFGSREGFVEPLNKNISLLRRRLKTPDLTFERHVVGSASRTQVCLAYLRSEASPAIVQQVRQNLRSVNLKVALCAGFLSPFLVRRSHRFIFSGSGYSERPDTVCGKLAEGRVAVLIDGTPMAVIVPYLFVENFQTYDDYAMRPFYATFLRWLKYIAFFIALLLPGLYAALTTFHPEFFPDALLRKIAQAEQTTPFPVTVEVLLMILIYEIMREAGLRVPRVLSHAVSIVGALVVGDAAISSGLVGAPTVMVVALAAISSYVVPSLYEQISVGRLIFVVLGGLTGFWGLFLGSLVVLINICGQMTYDVPFAAPVSPTYWKGLEDVFVRASWQRLFRHNARVQDMPGSEVGDTDGR